jgi:hypothetical protein
MRIELDRVRRDGISDSIPSLVPDSSVRDSLRLIPSAPKTGGHVARIARKQRVERAGERFGAATGRLFGRGRTALRELSAPVGLPTAGGPSALTPSGESQKPIIEMPARHDRPAVHVAPDDTPLLRERVEQHLRTLDGVQVVADSTTGLILIQPAPDRIDREVPRGPMPARRATAPFQPQAAVQVAEALFLLPPVRGRLIQALGSRRVDAIGLTLNFATWGLAYFFRSAPGPSWPLPSSPTGSAGIGVLRPGWIRPGTQSSAAVLGMTILGFAVILIGATPFGALLSAFFPSPVVACVVSAAGIASAFLR